MKTITQLMVCLTWMVVPLILAGQAVDTSVHSLKPRVILLNLSSSEYQELFHGAPGTVAMHSGLVTLETGQSVGTHNSENYEEIIVFLEGEGELQITDGDTLQVGYGAIAYCPPHTEHNVISTGTIPLKYIYVAAKVLPEEATPPE
ncbi:MAG: cupin domain-containing protein [Bacteroidetes bacterium]|nr:MAG: cupin domain-containing protein [Bacteroidota bacterium]